ncbi:hypothetical protein [Shewanella waksmanii]|uniref:hypothetical protein n=1 Tax=Shewanella waksmanii TaxID=213783 RepID=UPI00373652A3
MANFAINRRATSIGLIIVMLVLGFLSAQHSLAHVVDEPQHQAETCTFCTFKQLQQFALPVTSPSNVATGLQPQRCVAPLRASHNGTDKQKVHCRAPPASDV